MNIDEQGITLSSLNEIIGDAETNLQGTYGVDFFIKPEGVIDNIFTSAAFMDLNLQEQIAFLAKQFDPESAEGTWQDALYERLNIYRLAPEATTFDLQLSGVAAYVGSAGDITIRSNVTQEEFQNTESYTFDNDGLAIIKFACVIPAKTEVAENETFSIVTAPTEIFEIISGTLNNIDIGRNRETDAEFRTRFKSSKALNAKSSANAIISNLTPYVDNIAFLEVLDRKNDLTIPAGTLEVIAKHNTTDEIFAQAIFNTIACGISTQGNTTETVYDSENQAVTISFYNADEIDIDIEATIKIKTGYYQSTVFNMVKESIIKYITEKVYGLNSTVYATELIIPCLQVDGVEAVTDIQIKRSTDLNYSPSVSLTKYEVPLFDSERITLNAAV